MSSCNRLKKKITDEIVLLVEDYDIVEEVFLDRAYNTDLSLVSRDLKGAVYQDKELKSKLVN